MLSSFSPSKDGFLVKRVVLCLRVFVAKNFYVLAKLFQNLKYCFNDVMNTNMNILRVLKVSRQLSQKLKPNDIRITACFCRTKAHWRFSAEELPLSKDNSMAEFCLKLSCMCSFRSSSCTNKFHFFQRKNCIA